MTYSPTSGEVDHTNLRGLNIHLQNDCTEIGRFGCSSREGHSSLTQECHPHSGRGHVLAHDSSSWAFPQCPRSLCPSCAAKARRSLGARGRGPAGCSDMLGPPASFSSFSPLPPPPPLLVSLSRLPFSLFPRPAFLALPSYAPGFPEAPGGIPSSSVWPQGPRGCPPVLSRVGIWRFPCR